MTDAAREAARPPTPNDLLENHVGTVVSRLQRGYLSDGRGRPAAVASLARLRREVENEPGSRPGVWEETLEGIPEALQGRDHASRYERAAHVAITLYALHQQSRADTGMHDRDVRFGQALGRLSQRNLRSDEKRNTAVTRRFHALSTASSFAELTHHARGLIAQLRAARIGFDYGRFAVDLADLLDPRRADGVRLRWGRDYVFLIRADDVLAEDAAGDTGEQ